MCLETTCYPRNLKIWPLMGLTAMKNGVGDAWRLWLLAKNLDNDGRGSIESDKLVSFAHYLQIHPRSFCRWLSRTEGMGLITPCLRKTGDLWLILASHSSAAEKFGCFYVGRQPVSVSPQVLVNNGWHAQLWATYISTLPGRPISRSRLKEITGVPESTQRQYERSTGIIRRPNYFISDKSIEHLPGIREFLYPNAFPFWDKENRRWVVARRGPDSRDGSEFAYRLNRGRSKKINKELSQQCGSFHVERAQSDDGLIIRLFNDTPEQVRETERKLRKEGVSNQDISEIFEHLHTGKNADFWREVQE